MMTMEVQEPPMPLQSEPSTNALIPHPEKLCRMLGPGSTPHLVQVAALSAERLADEGGDAAQELLLSGAIPLLVRQLGVMLDDGCQTKGAGQIARALVAIAGIGTAFQDVIAADRGVEALLRGIEHPSSDVTAVAAAALGNLTANNNKIKRRVRAVGGIPKLIRLIERATEEGDRFTIGAVATSLRNLTSGNSQDTKEEIEKVKGAQVVLAALTRCKESVESIHQILSFLNNYCCDFPTGRGSVVAAGGVGAVLDVLNDGDPVYHPLTRATTLCLWNLVLGDLPAQTALLDAGGLPLLIQLLVQAPHASDEHLNVLGILCSMATTSYEVTEKLAISGAISAMIGCLRPPCHDRVSAMVMDAIEQMSYASADPMREYLCEYDAIPAMLGVLKDRDQDDPLTCGILTALANMVDGYHDAQLNLCEAGGLPQLVEYLMLVFRPGGCSHPTIAHVSWIMCHLSDGLEGAIFIKKNCGARLLVRSIMSGPQNTDWPYGPAIQPAVAAIGRMAFHNENIRGDLLDNLAVNAIIAIQRVLRKAKISGRKDKQHEALENACIMALSNLSEGNVGQEVLRQQGGMHVFATTLQQGPAAEGAMDSVLAIGHMSLDNKENQDSLREAGSFEALTEMLRHSHVNPEYHEMREACLKSLQNMLTGNQENQVYFGNVGGVEILSEIFVDSMSTVCPDLTSGSRSTTAASASTWFAPAETSMGTISECGSTRPPLSTPLNRLRSQQSALSRSDSRGGLPPARPMSRGSNSSSRPGSRGSAGLRVADKGDLRPTSSPSVGSRPYTADTTKTGADGIELDPHGRLVLDSIGLLCEVKENSDNIRESGIMHALVQLVSGKQEMETKKVATKALARCAQHATENQLLLAEAGALERLIETLDHRYSGKMDLETRSWVCVALSQCVSGNPETQEKLGSTGIEAIVSVLANMDDLGIKAKAAEALRNVAENEINCIYIATLGGVQQLLEALKIPDWNAPVVWIALTTLQKLSWHEQSRLFANKHGAPKVLAELVKRSVDKQGNGIVAKTACDTISLLILEPKYKASANKMGVIPDFVRLLRLPVTGEVTCAVGMTLISLVDGSIENRKEFRKCLGIRPVVKLLAAGPDADVTVASCRLIALLSTERENKEVLRNTNVMEYLLPVLKDAPESPATIHALRAIEGVCDQHYMNQNTARSAGLLDETMRLLKLGGEFQEAVAAAAAAVASMCNSGNTANIRVFRDLDGLEALLSFIKGVRLSEQDGADVSKCLAAVTEQNPSAEPIIDMLELVKPLVELLELETDNPATAQALSALSSLSFKRDSYKLAIARLGAIPAIIRHLQGMTQSPDNPVALYGSRLLDNLSSDEKHKNKNAIRQEGGLVPLVSLLRMATSPELQLATASAIGHICWGDSRPVKFLVKGNGIMALCRLIRPSADPRVVTAAAWALRAATATPEMALDLIAAEQGIKQCVRILSQTSGEGSDVSTHVAFLLSQFAMDERFHEEIIDRSGVEAAVSVLKFNKGNSYELKTYLVRMLCGLADNPTGRETIRRLGGATVLVDVFRRDCIPEGMHTNMSILTSEALWHLSYDRLSVLRMKESGLIPMLVDITGQDPDKVSQFHCLCILSIMSEVDACQQTIINAGGLDLLIKLLTVRFAGRKINFTAAVALRNFCNNAKFRMQMRRDGALESLCSVLEGVDMEASVESLITISRLVKTDGARAVDALVQAGAIGSIKTMLQERPKTGELVTSAQEILLLIKETSPEGALAITEAGADACLEEDAGQIRHSINARLLRTRPSLTMASASFLQLQAE